MFKRTENKSAQSVSPLDALPDRENPIEITGVHFVKKTPMQAEFENLEIAYFSMGCFWGAERLFWELDDVYTTAVGYQGGYTKNPTYEDVCTRFSGHAETVKVVYDPDKISFKQLLSVFFQEHDPTQIDRQGNDMGTQYRSAIYATTQDQLATAKEVAESYSKKLMENGFGPIATEIKLNPSSFFYAEEPHQQYLAKNPNGYCGLEATGVTCNI